jgi:hypothetical protein
MATVLISNDQEALSRALGSNKEICLRALLRDLWDRPDELLIQFNHAAPVCWLGGQQLHS